MKRPRMSLLLLVAFALCVSGCAHKGPATPKSGSAGTEGAGPRVPLKGLAGTDWMVEEIRGRPVIDRALTALRFDADGRASGSTGCNNFSGGTTMDAKRVSFGPMATTRRACEPGLMTQERELLDAFGLVRSYSVAPEGALDLLAEDGTPLVRLTHVQSPKQAPGDEITVKGELAAGAECPMVVAADGRRYSLAGRIEPYKIGDRVCVNGKIAEMSICMAGEATIEIRTVAAEASCP